MQAVEARLGRKPRFGTWDCAFDAHYVYDYFDQAGGFAAVPFNSGKKGANRQFAEDGTPLAFGYSLSQAAILRGQMEKGRPESDR